MTDFCAACGEYRELHKIVVFVNKQLYWEYNICSPCIDRVEHVLEG